MDGDLRFALLGPVAVRRGPVDVPVGTRHQRLLLALLLARAGAPAATYEIERLLWPGGPPPTATNMIHRYVSNLRRVFEPRLPLRSPGRWLVSEPGGYRLPLTTRTSDLLDFRARIAQAAARAEAGDDRAALSHLTAGLSLWQGRCAAGLGEAADLYPPFVAIDGEYLAAARTAGEVALRCGGAAQALPFLREAAVRSPLDETLHAALFRVLAADGKQAEAVARHGDLRARLAGELGVGPGPELQAVFQALLRHTSPGPGAEDPGPVRPTGIGPGLVATSPVRPAQLPADLLSFTGRAAQLREAEVQLGSTTGVPIIAFDGMAGVGKTALTVHLAHRAAARFPDGQLYADLHGYDAERRADPAAVLDDFLFALGLDPGGVPARLDAKAALYRSALAGRRVLVVLDNAGGADQIQPLLPGSAGNAVLVTSRNRLTALSAAHGAHLHNLDVLKPEEARACFARRIGAARAEAESAALDEIIDRCGGLPLALAIVASRVLTDHGRSLTATAADLRRSRGTLDGFSGDDVIDIDIRAVFAWSYRMLSTGAAALLRSLAARAGTEATLRTAAEAAGVPETEAQGLLQELVRNRLLGRCGADRYQLHELVRAYAAEADPATV